MQELAAAGPIPSVIPLSPSTDSTGKHERERREERNGCHIHGLVRHGRGPTRTMGGVSPLGSSTVGERPLLPDPARVDTSRERPERAATSAKRDFQGSHAY